ncbi:MAG TPA: mechanosensitive ion channel family protein [Steroidobacteraceae bacterium]|nr:mechanosensitive ion channel family protein [Steroidobacteraceae bacterium]
MNELSELLALKVLDNSLLQWAIALLAFLVTFTVLPLLRGYIATLRKRHAGGHHATAVELSSLLANRTHKWFLWAVAFWFAARTLNIPSEVDVTINRIMFVLLALQVGIWASAAMSFRLHHRRGATLEADPSGALAIVNFVAAIIIWSLVTLVALDNLGVNITALVAGLGITGIAVALAVQTTLSNLLSSLAIALDKPFVVGDTITVDQDTGKVERIGISSTRLRSIDGEQIVISNNDLLKARVHNFGRMYERRVLFTVGVVYATPRETLERIPSIIEAAVRAHEKVRFERSHFVAYGDSALQFESVYFVLDADYLLYANIEQAINLRILQEFERQGIELAYRTRITVATAATDDDEEDKDQSSSRS